MINRLEGRLSIELESKDPKEDPLALSDRDLEYELMGAYLTLDPEYKAAQKDSVLWSPSSRTALPEAELEILIFFQPPIRQVGLGEQQVTGTIVAAITRSFLEMAR
ncbi:hypothetical protein Tco_1401395 [Tanacetum coccineum]